MLLRSLKYGEDIVDMTRQIRGKANVPTPSCETTRGPSGHLEETGKAKNPQFNENCEQLSFNCSAMTTAELHARNLIKRHDALYAIELGLFARTFAREWEERLSKIVLLLRNPIRGSQNNSGRLI